MTVDRDAGTAQGDEGSPSSIPGADEAGTPHTETRIDQPSVGHPSSLFPARSSRRRSRWGLVALVVAAVVLLTALLAFGLSRDPAVIRSPLVGLPAPDFDLPTLEGRGPIRLSDFRGQVVVVNFWASWCAACHQEHPNLVAAWERYRDRGVVLLGIDYQDSRQAALAYMAEMGGDWPVLEDPDGRTALAYGVFGVPETFFIGRDGVIAYKRVGASSYELLTGEIQLLLSRSR